MSNAANKTKTSYYGTPRQEIGRETNGGSVVTTLSDREIDRMLVDAWSRSDVHDLTVLEFERDSRH